MAVYAAESERLWLQNLSVEEHLQDLFEIMSAPAAMHWSTNPAHTDPQQTLELMLRSMPTPTEPWNQRWAIMLRPISKVDSTGADTVHIDTGNGVKPVKPKMIGIVGTPRRGELAYKLSPGYWGNGYMSEALKLLFEMWWGMNENKEFTRLVAAADPENAASTRVLEKAGFRKMEGGYKAGFYERAVHQGVKKSDLQYFYLERPTV